ncbi:MAG: TolC family protein [Bacteroidaceae bacterium]|nr:TolC family protein [Bacteroidaceae bacterium]
MVSTGVQSQTILSLQECRDMALKNNRESAIAQEKVTAAGYDRKAARSNYFPKVSITGGYLHNGDNISLLSPDLQNGISNIGTAVGNIVSGIQTDPQFMALLYNSPTLQYLASKLMTSDLSGKLNNLGTSIADRFTFDISNLYVGAISVEEPIYVGGKIRAYNKVTAYAEELAATQLEGEDRKIMVATDEAYWQVVSVADKLKLADQYVDLLKKLDSDVEKMKNEGVATESDLLSVKVKLNEAEMTQLKAQNGLVLAKMLLCQLCGLDLHSDIQLADERNTSIDVPKERLEFTQEDIEENRPELKSLRLATQMYGQKVNIVRSDYLPSIALMGNYILTNPNIKHGFEKEFAGTWNVGVIARIPVFHFGEGVNKIRKAKSEALISQYQLEDIRQKIMLQATQYEQKLAEADSRLQMARKNLDNAEENLRMANIGFQEGMLESSVVMQAQTAWLKAHSEETDARIDRIMADVYLRQATGLWNK